ncbi:MAG: 30S ribosomal protein S6 [Candidatus Eisenbacteria bacterium]
MRNYEGTFIFRPGLDEAGLEAEMAKVEEMITAEGGAIKEWDKWGKRRLSYEIKGEYDGYYAFLTFEADPAAIERLVEAYRLREDILRNMNIVMDQ